ncbi:MAG: DUF1805 domain-containing protein [Candidatus Altiarchaeota archaeon]
MEFKPYVIELENANLVLLKAKNGYVMCGLLNIETAERLGQAAAIVTAVKSAEDALKAKIKSATTAAMKLGVKEGMSGEEAIKKMS